MKAWDENDSLLGLLKKTGSRYHCLHFILHCKVLVLIGYFSSRILAALIAKSRKQALISMRSARAFYLAEQITSTGASMKILIYDHHQHLSSEGTDERSQNELCLLCCLRHSLPSCCNFAFACMRAWKCAFTNICAPIIHWVPLT